jgi:hypothetical protein
MKRYNVDGGIPTLELALSEFMNSDDLKKLAALTKEKLPTRKADLAAVIMRHLVREALEGWIEKDGYTVSVALDGLDRRDRQLVSGAGRGGSSPRVRLSRLETPGAAAHPAGMD